MEDRYLFRAKRIYNGEWVGGSLICEPYGMEIQYLRMVDGRICKAKVNPQTICQCTGLRDKNGKLIWENDIVSLVGASGVGFGRKELVEYEKGGYIPFSVAGWECVPRASECEVIGNVFDNPELLEE